MRQTKRLDRLEQCLAPKEAVILWLQEANRYSDVMEYLKYLRDQPEALRPITRVTNQVESAIRETMKGQTPEDHRCCRPSGSEGCLFPYKAA